MVQVFVNVGKMYGIQIILSVKKQVDIFNLTLSQNSALNVKAMVKNKYQNQWLMNE